MFETITNGILPTCKFERMIVGKWDDITSNALVDSLIFNKDHSLKIMLNGKPTKPKSKLTKTRIFWEISKSGSPGHLLITGIMKDIITKKL